MSAKPSYDPPPAIGDIFNGPPSVNTISSGRIARTATPYQVVAIVDLGFFENDPTYFQVVFRFWSKTKCRYAWIIEGADALQVGLYTPKKKRK